MIDQKKMFQNISKAPATINVLRVFAYLIEEFLYLANVSHWQVFQA
jgi:hypothetical protein